MSQNNVNYADNPTGPQLMDNYLAKSQENNLTTNSGIQRPTYAKAGTFWINSSANPWVLYFYNGSTDVAIGTIGTGSSGTFSVEGVDLSNYVDKSTAQTVGGTKTFTSPLTIKNTVDESLGTTQERDWLSLRESNNTTTGIIRQYWTTTQNQLRIRNIARHGEVAGSWGDLQQTIDSNGNYRISITCQGTLVNQALTSATSSTTNIDIPTKGWVNNPDTSTNVVHRSGNETVGGTKTFTEKIVRKHSQQTAFSSVSAQVTAITKGTNPTTNTECRWFMTDSGGDFGNAYSIAGMLTGYATSGITSAALLAFKPEANSTVNSRLGIYYPATGSAYTEAPTPATSDNSTKIATTAFVKAQGYIGSDDLATVDVVTEYSLGTKGYIKFSNNFIIQWGITTSASQNTSITLPTPFTNTNYSVNITSMGDSGVYQRLVSVSTARTTTKFTTYTSGGASSLNFSWMAMGY